MGDDKGEAGMDLMRRFALALVTVALCASLWGVAPLLVRAAPLTVINCNDSGVGSLRAAITTASNGDIIGFTPGLNCTSASAGPITLTSGTLTIATSLTIDGTGATIIVDGGGTTTVFAIGSGVTATLRGLTIQHGSTAGNGGGINNGNGGALTVANCTIANNTANLAGGGGSPGIINTGTLIVTNSTIANNTGGNTGGAIGNLMGTVTVTNSTIAGNSSGAAGGIENSNGTLTVTSSTLSGNTGTFMGGVGGILTEGFPGLGPSGGVATLTDTIVAASTGGDLGSFIGGTFAGTNNLVDDATTAGGFVNGTNGNIVGQSPLLGTLGNNGGPTQTIPLLAGSPAIDAGAPVGGTIPNTDQRGVHRPQGSGVDIGAFEVAPYTTVVNSTVDGTADAANCASGNASTCRLRDAIQVVNQALVPSSPTPTITFAVNGTIALNSGTLPVSAPVSIDATGPAHAIVVDGGCTGCDPGGTPSNGVIVFRVTGGTAAQPVTLAGLTIRHGYGTLGSGGGGINNSSTLHVTNSTVTANAAASNGGGIANTGTLSVTGSTITNNRIYSSFMYGGTGIDNAAGGTLTVTGSTITGNSGAPGAIQNEGEGSTATVTNSTISGNDAGSANDGGGLSNTGRLMTVVGSTISGNSGNAGGGISNFGASLSVTDSTIAANTASFRGGGIFAGAGSGAVTLTNITLSGNSATDAGGGIVAQSNVTITLTNTIVAGSGATGGDLAAISGGAFTGSGNLIDDAASAGGFADGANGNSVGHPALLGTLGNYGGLTQTVPLLPGSPAIDAGAAVGSGPAGNTVPSTDQRGKPRLAAPDIGAFESQGFTLTPAAGSTPQSAVVNTAFTNPLALTVAAVNSVEPVAGGIVTFAPPASGPSATLSGSPVTIGAGGAASATATANGIKGAYTIAASAAGSGSATFALTNTAPLVSIAVAPNPVIVKVGQVQQFTATGTYADSSTTDLTSQVTWGSDAPGVASVDASGKGAAKVAGTAHITATQGSVSGQATVTVTPPVLTGVQPAPAPASRPGGASTSGAATPAPAPAPTGR